ncbi:hypothetical protein DIPPA_11365 [Diplonema papillatum]|nr:hypothetical protein DIPPA_11365 [Diplonema papillatum]
MPFADVLKSAVAGVVEAVSGSSDGGVTKVIGKKVILIKPPSDSLSPGSLLLGRNAEWLADRIKQEGGDKCLLMDVVGLRATKDIGVRHQGPLAVFEAGKADASGSAFQQGREAHGLAALANMAITVPLTAPPLQMMWSMIAAIATHLGSSEESSVCILADPAFDGRVGLVLVGYAVFSNLYGDEQKAIQWYRLKRPGVQFKPSQIRYVSHFMRQLHDSGPKRFFSPPEEVPLLIRLITLRRVPFAIAMRAKLILEVEHVRAVYAHGDPFSNKAKTIRTIVHSPGDNGIIEDKAAIAGMEFVDIQLLINAHVTDDFAVVLWSVNDFRRREALFSLQLHSSFMLDVEHPSQNGVVRCFTQGQLDDGQSMGRDFKIEIDVVKERRAEPRFTMDGSIVIVDSTRGDSLSATEPGPRPDEDVQKTICPTEGGGTATEPEPSSAPRMHRESEPSTPPPQRPPVQHQGSAFKGGGVSPAAKALLKQLALPLSHHNAEDEPRTHSPVSLGASTIARIASQDLLGGSSMDLLGSGTTSFPTTPTGHHQHHPGAHPALPLAPSFGSAGRANSYEDCTHNPGGGGGGPASAAPPQLQPPAGSPAARAAPEPLAAPANQPPHIVCPPPQQQQQQQQGAEKTTPSNRSHPPAQSLPRGLSDSSPAFAATPTADERSADESAMLEATLPAAPKQRSPSTPSILTTPTKHTSGRRALVSVTTSMHLSNPESTAETLHPAQPTLLSTSPSGMFQSCLSEFTQNGQ